MNSTQLANNFIDAVCRSKEEQVVVYGFASCGYDNVREVFARAGKKAFDWQIGRDLTNFSKLKEKGVVPLKPAGFTRICKNALVYLVLENYLRKMSGQEIVPLVFCIDMEKNTYSPPSTEEIFSRKEEDYVSHIELRRMAKLCFDEDISRDVRKVALETFKYVKVNCGVKLNLEEVQSPFTEQEFALYIAQRRAGKVTYGPNTVGYIRRMNKIDWKGVIADTCHGMPPLPEASCGCVLL